MNVLIVEDEMMAQANLARALTQHFPDVRIVGTTGSVRETVLWLRTPGNSADVIFMDVELSDGDCFEIFRQADVTARVIMTTAYDNYAVRAFEVNSIDYLLKPLTDERGVYRYKLVDGQLQIAEEEAEVIRIIYDKYIHTTMGTARIANWLNEHGYSKVCRHNNKREAFTGSFLIGVLDNPVYCGKLAYGRRHNEKIPGTRNQYHIVKQKDYTLYDGIHEPIISEEDWQLAQKQRQQTNKRQLKTHSLDHEHVLSGLLKCPVCGGGMYGNVNRKKKGDGTYYRDYFYYACKHRLHVDGKRCDYHHQWGEEIIDGAVEEIIHKLVNTPAFEQGIREKIGGKLDTAELDTEMETLRKQLRQLTGTKDRLGEQIDALDFDDPHYTRKTQDLQERQNRVYDQIASIEVSIAEVQTRMDNIRQRRISTDNVYQFLLYFDKLYDQFTDLEKKTFMNSFIERVEIYPERRSDGRIVKRIEFRFPVYFNGSKITGLGWDKTDMSENVMVLAKL